MSTKAFSLHGDVSVSTRPAADDLRAFRTELKRTATAMKDVFGAKFTLSPKASTRAVKGLADTVSRETEKAAKQATAAMLREQKQQLRDQEKATREALRRQKQFGADWAREIEATYRRSGDTFDRFGSRIKTISGHLKDISREVKATRLDFKIDPTRDVNRQLDSISKQIFAAQRAAAGLHVNVDTVAAQKQIEELLKPLRDAKSSTLKVDVSSNGSVQAAGSGSDVAAAADAVKSRIDQIAEARDELLGNLSQIATVSGAAITGGLGLAAKEAVTFDGALREVNANAKLTEAQLEKLGDSVLQLSFDPKIQKDAVNLTGALTSIYSVGYQGQEALNILRQSAIGATGAFTDTDVAAKGLLATMNSGIPGVKTARQAMDVLFKTVEIGDLSFEDLAGTIGSVLPTAAKAGIPIQEIGAALAVMTKNGQSASEATNDLNNFIAKVLNPGKEAQKEFRNLGIQYGYAALQGKGVVGILKEIQEKTKGQGDKIKEILPDMQAGRGVLSLLTESGKQYSLSLQEMRRASDGMGAAMEASTKATEGVSGSVVRSQKEFKNFSILVGSTVVPALNSTLHSVSGLFQWFNKLPQSTQENTVKFAAYSGGALLLAGRLKGIVDTLALLKTALGVNRVATVAATAATTANSAANGVNAVSAGRLSGTLAALRVAHINTAAAAAAGGAASAGAGVSWAALAASLGTVAAVTLPALVAGLGIAGTAIEKHKEKTLLAKEAAHDLNATSKLVADSFSKLRQFSELNAASQAVANLQKQYDSLKGTPEGLKTFALSAIPKAEQQIKVNLKLEPFERRLLLDALKQLQSSADAKSIKLKVDLDGKSMQKSQSWVTDFQEAFHQQWGSIVDVFREWNREMEKIDSKAQSIDKQIADWFNANFAISPELSNSLSAIQSWVTGIGNQIENWFDTNFEINPDLARGWNRALGRGDNYGETDTPSLPADPQATAIWSKVKRVTPAAKQQQLRDLITQEAKRKQAEEKRRGQERRNQENLATLATAANTEDSSSSRRKAAAKEAADALRKEKDALRDNVTAWRERAQMLNDFANREIERIQSVHGALKDFFGDVQERFVAQGIIDDPLGPVIAGFEKLLNLGPQLKVFAKNARDVINSANSRADGLGSKLEKVSGQDGKLPGRAGGNLTASIVDQMASSIKTPRGQASCAYFASMFMQQLGMNIPTTGPARDLVSKFKAMGGVQVSREQAQLGDLIAYHGRRYGKLKDSQGMGWHVGVAAGNGMMWDSSGNGPNNQRRRKIDRNAMIFSLGSTIGGINRLFNSDAASVGGGDKIEEILSGNWDAALSKVKAVPKAWGDAVKDVEGHSVRFALQTKLASSEFQKSLELAALVSGKTVPEIIKWLREFANAADFKLNRNSLIEGVKNQIKEVEAATKGIGRDNPLAMLNDQLKDGKFKGVPKELINKLYNATSANQMSTITQAIKDNVKALQERAKALLLEQTLLQNGALTEEERNDRLEIETQRAERITALVRANMPRDIAEMIADQEAKQNAFNKSLERGNALMKQEHSLALERAAQLGENIEKMKEELADKAFDKFSGIDGQLSKLFGASNLSAEELRSTILELGQDAQLPGVNRLLNMLQSKVEQDNYATLTGDLLDRARSMQSDSALNLATDREGRKRLNPLESALALRDKLMNEFATAQMAAGPGADPQKVAEDLADFTQLLDNFVSTTKTNMTEANAARVGDYLRDVQNHVAQALETDPIERELLNIKQQLTQDGWSEEDIQKVLPTARWGMEMDILADRISGFLDGVHSSFENAFQQIYADGPGSFFKNVLKGFADLFNQVSSRVLSQGLMDYVTGIFGGNLSSILGGRKSGGGMGLGAIAAGLGLPGHRDGLDRVPYDDYVARLHKNEMVLPAPAAEQYRAGGDGRTVIVNQIHIAQVVTPNPQQFMKELPGQRASSREMQYQARRQIGN